MRGLEHFAHALASGARDFYFPQQAGQAGEHKEPGQAPHAVISSISPDSRLGITGYLTNIKRVSARCHHGKAPYSAVYHAGIEGEPGPRAPRGGISGVSTTIVCEQQTILKSIVSLTIICPTTGPSTPRLHPRGQI